MLAPRQNSINISPGSSTHFRFLFGEALFDVSVLSSPFGFDGVSYMHRNEVIRRGCFRAIHHPLMVACISQKKKTPLK
jgi:hypothetical protein